MDEGLPDDYVYPSNPSQDGWFEWMGGHSGDSVDAGLEVAAVGAEAAKVAGSVVAEPLDWYLTAEEIYKDPTDLSSYVGLLPLVPTAVGKGYKLARKATDAAHDARNALEVTASAPANAVLRSSNKLNSVERATPKLLDAIRSKNRIVKIVQEGSEESRYLDFIGAEANVGGETMSHILLRQNPGKAAALEEFLHGTQHRLGIIDRLGVDGSEKHVKDFMIRHRRLLGLSDEDVDILRQLMEAGL